METKVGTQNQQEIANGQVKQYVCFKLASEEFGLEITDIQEVIRMQPVTAVPQVPEFVLGIINVRGNVIPVFDFRKKMMLPEKAFDESTKIVIANVDHEVFGAVVDEILENVNLGEDQIDPAPNVKMKIAKDCISGLGKLENRMICILNLKKIHEAIRVEIANG